jgi:hypothetical protein
MCGKYEVFMICERSWNVPVIIACEATIAASIDMTRDGQNMPGGTVLKKGFEYASGWTEI